MLRSLESSKTPIEWTQTLTKQLYFDPLKPHEVEHPLKFEEKEIKASNSRT